MFVHLYGRKRNMAIDTTLFLVTNPDFFFPEVRPESLIHIVFAGTFPVADARSQAESRRQFPCIEPRNFPYIPIQHLERCQMDFLEKVFDTHIMVFIYFKPGRKLMVEHVLVIPGRRHFLFVICTRIVRC